MQRQKLMIKIKRNQSIDLNLKQTSRHVAIRIVSGPQGIVAEEMAGLGEMGGPTTTITWKNNWDHFVLVKQVNFELQRDVFTHEWSLWLPYRAVDMLWSHQQYTQRSL